MPLTTKAIDDVILAADHNEIYNLLKGVTGNGEMISLIHNAAGTLLLQPESNPAAGTQLFQIKNAAGTVQLALTSDGDIVLGTAASVLIPGATSFAIRNNADNADNLLVSDAGIITARSYFSGNVITAGSLTAGGNAASAVQISASGPLVYAGSGAPGISAAVKGSLYLRTDGSSGSTRAYIATDTVGGWTAITTAT